MKKLLIFLIVTALLAHTTIAKQVCKTVSEKVCNKVRREPFTKNVIERVPVVKTYKVIEKRQVPYKQKVCKSKKVKVSIKVPYEVVEKVKVPAYKTEKVGYNVKVTYYEKQPREKKVYYTQTYVVQVPKKFTVKYTETQVKKEKRTKKSICLKNVKENYTKKVLKPYQTTCPKEVERLVLKNKEVLETKTLKKKYWLGTYSQSKDDCYKKNYGWKYYTKKVPVTKKVAIKEKVTVKVPCVKKKYVDEKCTREVVKKYECEKHYTVNVPYKVTKTKVVERKVPEKRTRKLFKVVKYEVSVKKEKTVRKFKDVVKKYEITKNVKVMKFKDSFRYDHQISFDYVTKYRTVHEVVTKTKTVHVNKVKSVPAYYYTNKCEIKNKNVCKEVKPTTSTPKYTRREEPRPKYSRRD